MLKTITTLAALISFQTFATPTFDKIEELNGVELKSGKEDAVRSYVGSVQKTLPYSIDLVKKGVTNFTEKCNNTLKDKRKYTSEEVDCKYHNENIVETFVINDFRKNNELNKYSETYLLGRQIYNRGAFGYYELVTVSEEVEEDNRKTVKITLRMLDDKEVSGYISPKFSRESAFDHSTSVFTLVQLSSQETQVRYEYSALTDHWLLNKEVSVPQVFVSISKSINDLLKTIEEESSIQKRQLASKE